VSLYIPPLYERRAVYDETGNHAGYIVRAVTLQSGEVFEPIVDGWYEDTLGRAINMARKLDDEAFTGIAEEGLR